MTRPRRHLEEVIPNSEAALGLSSPELERFSTVLDGQFIKRADGKPVRFGADELSTAERKQLQGHYIVQSDHYITYFNARGELRATPDVLIFELERLGYRPLRDPAPRHLLSLTESPGPHHHSLAVAIDAMNNDEI